MSAKVKSQQSYPYLREELLYRPSRELLRSAGTLCVSRRILRAPFRKGCCCRTVVRTTLCVQCYLHLRRGPFDFIRRSAKVSRTQATWVWKFIIPICVVLVRIVDKHYLLQKHMNYADFENTLFWFVC